MLPPLTAEDVYAVYAAQEEVTPQHLNRMSHEEAARFGAMPAAPPVPKP